MADSDVPVVFHCQVGGDPLPKIHWRKLEGEIKFNKYVMNNIWPQIDSVFANENFSFFLLKIDRLFWKIKH